jgi:tRNA pseudouridine55 synthase
VDGAPVIDGLAIVDKPAGMTSHDVVGRCRRLFAQKRVGHAGTLDPDATGILLIGLGRATRLLRYVSGLPKSYRGQVVLGVATTTLDAAGEVVGRWDQRKVTVDDARRAAASLTGDIAQIPPMVSAVKVGGRRLHQLARRGLEVERPARQVTVSRFAVADAGVEGDSRIFAVEVDCSSGTYVRVLAADLGARLGGGAHLRHLRRTAVGPWREADAVALDELTVADVRPPVEAIPWLDRLPVAGERLAQVTHGRVLDRSDLDATGPGPWRITDGEGRLVAVYHDGGEGRVKPAVVLVGDAN